jgi:hypothetical protein
VIEKLATQQDPTVGYYSSGGSYVTAKYPPADPYGFTYQRFPLYWPQ